MAGTVKAVSLVDSLRWMEGEGDDRHVETFDGPGAGVTAKGQEVDIPSKEFDRLEKAGAVGKSGNSDSSSGGFPTNHDDLDELAAGVAGITVEPGTGKKKSTWNGGTVKTTVEKIAALEAAGVKPDGSVVPGDPDAHGEPQIEEPSHNNEL